MIEEYLEEEFLHLTSSEQNVDLLEEAFLTTAINALNPSDAICVDCKLSIRNSILIMQENKVGSLVVTRNNKIFGIITERDLLLKFHLDDNIDYHNPISILMTPDPVVLYMTDPLIYALHNMYVGEFRHIPIIDPTSAVLKIISIKDVNQFLLMFYEDIIQNITGEPFRGIANREGA